MNSIADYIARMIECVNQGYKYEPIELLAVRENMPESNGMLGELAKLVFNNVEDANRYRYVQKLASIASPKMDGQHYWKVHPLYTTGNTYTEALDKARSMNASHE